MQTGGRQTKPVSGLLGGEEGGCCGVLIAEHDGAMLASKCEIYQVNSGELGVKVVVKPLVSVTIQIGRDTTFLLALVAQTPRVKRPGSKGQKRSKYCKN